jgi:preprotein translocase subunit SecB
MQLSPSPLSIVAHEFREIQIKAAEEDQPKGSLGLNFNRKWGAIDNDPLNWILELTVEFGGDQVEAKAPYAGLMRIEGIFKINKDYPEDKRDSLIRVTGASILYGACREMLANLTARSSHGMISLPSVSFISAPSASEKTLAKKKQGEESRTLPEMIGMTAYFDAWQRVDSDEGVPLAVANRVFGKDALKPIIEELNEILVA